MTLEQLEALKRVFERLEDLKYQLKRFENNEYQICVREPNGCVRYSYLLYDIMEKYKVNIIEDLKNEIKRYETELEGISILQINKLV